MSQCRARSFGNARPAAPKCSRTKVPCFNVVAGDDKKSKPQSTACLVKLRSRQPRYNTSADYYRMAMASEEEEANAVFSS